MTRPKGIRQRAIDTVRLTALTKAGRSAKEIAHLLGCCDDTVRLYQQELGLRPRKTRVGNKYWYEGPIGYDAADSLQWKELTPWPDTAGGFQDAAVRREVMRRPAIPETQSGCGNSSALMETV